MSGPYREAASREEDRPCANCAPARLVGDRPGHWECGSCGRVWFAEDPRDERISKLEGVIQKALFACSGGDVETVYRILSTISAAVVGPPLEFKRAPGEAAEFERTVNDDHNEAEMARNEERVGSSQSLDEHDERCAIRDGYDCSRGRHLAKAEPNDASAHLRARVAVLEEALRWYAEAWRYHRNYENQGTPFQCDLGCAAEVDRGERARVALAAVLSSHEENQP